MSMVCKGEGKMESKGFFATFNVFSIVSIKAKHFFRMKITRACSLLITFIPLDLRLKKKN